MSLENSKPARTEPREQEVGVVEQTMGPAAVSPRLEEVAEEVGVERAVQLLEALVSKAQEDPRAPLRDPPETHREVSKVTSSRIHQTRQPLRPTKLAALPQSPCGTEPLGSLPVHLEAHRGYCCPDQWWHREALVSLEGDGEPRPALRSLEQETDSWASHPQAQTL